MLNINVDMLNARVLVTGLLLMGSVMAQKPTSWTTAQKEWALGTIAILSELNHNRFDLLAGAENPADVAAKDREFLIRLWQINSREDLLREIKLRWHIVKTPQESDGIIPW